MDKKAILLIITLILITLLGLYFVSADIEILGNSNDVINLETSTVEGIISGNLTTFLELLDTPDSYAGEGGNCVAVNVGETALEFASCGTGGGGNPFNQVLNTTSNVTFASVNTTIISSTTNISFYTNNDLDDFLRFSTSSNLPYLNIIGGDRLMFTSDSSNDLYLRAYEDSTHYCDFGWSKISNFCYLDATGGVFSFQDFIAFENDVNITKSLIVKQNITAFDSYCNATNCYKLSDFLIDTGGSMNYTNIAMTNKTNVFTSNQNFSANITMGTDQFICGNSTCGQYIKFNITGVYIQS
jgi:hypothetical protein